MSNNSLTNNERLARIETLMEVGKEALLANGQRSEEILNIVLEKIDALDTKIEGRFQSVETHASDDAKELQALKNKGAGVLAALGAMFTVTATVFSNFFSALHKLVFG